MTRNAALAVKVLARIEAHPEGWDQNTWHCGTLMCFAGHTVPATGAQWLDPKNVTEQYVIVPDGYDGPHVQDEGDKRVVHIEDYAKHVLGLKQYEVDAMFDEHNTLDDLRKMVRAIEEGRELV